MRCFQSTVSVEQSDILKPALLWHPEGMIKQPIAALGIDACGPSGTVALAKVSPIGGAILGQVALEGRTYSAALVAAVQTLMRNGGIALSQLGCIVVVNGPGSFTGVRVGVSAAKGLALGAGMPILAVSRLHVFAHKAGCPSAALDAHRHELYFRMETPGSGAFELLAGREQLAQLRAPDSIAVCEDSAAALVAAAWPNTQIFHSAAPTAVDAIGLVSPRIRAGNFDDITLLDGHYLRRSDAEIFGDKSRPDRSPERSAQ